MNHEQGNAQALQLIARQCEDFLNRLQGCFLYKVECTLLIRNLEVKDADLILTKDDLNKVILAIDELRKRDDH